MTSDAVDAGRFEEGQRAGRLHGVYSERRSTLLPATVWRKVVAAGDGPSTVLPDGCMDVIWHDGHLFVAGADFRPLLAVGAVGTLAVGLYTAVRPYALRRVLGFLDPWSRASNEGFQLVQSFVAFGRGGVTGVGIGDGRQKLFYLPEAHTDFILSVVAEEAGLVGVLIVLGGFAALLVAGLRIALAAKQRFALLLAFGMTALLVVPALLNAAVVMGCLPTKGLTLPFLSYGRSSLLVCCLAVGVLLSVARAGRAPRGGGS